MLSEFYITRDSGVDYIEVRPAHIGIKKIKGCVLYGSADSWLGLCMSLPLADCKYIFGFIPRKGDAWLIEGRKKTKIDLAFSR